MRILGIDPGLTRCGLGVVEVDDARHSSLVAVGVARSSASLATHFRLRDIAAEIRAFLDEYRPEVVAIERVFAHDNLQSVTTTMQVMGVAMACVGERGLPLAIHTPSEVKAAITGNGNADKAQVQHMVARILRLPEVVRPADAADALAIAICHGWRGSGLLGAEKEGDIQVTLSGGVSSRTQMTAAQKQWAEAMAATRRKGAVDPRRGGAR